MSSKYDSVWVPTLQGAFLTEYEGVINKQWTTPITRKYTDIGEYLKLVDLGTVGAVRQFTGPRQAIDPIVYQQTQQNLPYEMTMEIDAEDVRRDALGMFVTKASEMGAKFGDHINKLVLALMTANGNCFDGTTFFGTTHPVNGTTQSNDLSSTTSGIGADFVSANFSGSSASAPTAVMMATAIQSGITYFYSMVDEAGDPINGTAKDFEIVTSNPKIMASANAAINSLQLNQGVTNPLYAGLESKGWTFTSMLEPRLGALNSSVFYIFRTDSIVKPFAWGEEVGLEINYLGAGSYGAIYNNKYTWAAKAVRSAAFGRYQHSLRCTLS